MPGLTKTSSKLFGLVVLCCFLLVLGGYNGSRYFSEILRNDDYVSSDPRSDPPAQLRLVQEAKHSDVIAKCKKRQANLANLIFLSLVTLACFVGIFKFKKRLSIMLPVLCFSLLQTTSIVMQVYFIELPFLSLDLEGCAFVMLRLSSISVLFIMLILPLRDYRNENMCCPIKFMRSCWYVVLSVVPLLGLVISGTISKFKPHMQLNAFSNFFYTSQTILVLLVSSILVYSYVQTDKPEGNEWYLPNVSPVAPFIGWPLFWYVVEYIMIWNNYYGILEWSWIYGLVMLGYIFYTIARCPKDKFHDGSLIGVSTTTI